MFWRKGHDLCDVHPETRITGRVNEAELLSTMNTSSFSVYPFSENKRMYHENMGCPMIVAVDYGVLSCDNQIISQPPFVSEQIGMLPLWSKPLLQSNFSKIHLQKFLGSNVTEEVFLKHTSR